MTINEQIAMQAQLQAAQFKLIKICGVYQTVKPFIKLIRTLLFWKPKVQKVVDLLVVTMDEVCQTS